jgi:hypothetical protein
MSIGDDYLDNSFSNHRSYQYISIKVWDEASPEARFRFGNFWAPTINLPVKACVHERPNV